MRSISLLTFCLLATFPLSLQAQPAKSLLVDLQAGQYVGLPIHWGTIDAAILEPSGHIRVFHQNEVRQHRLLDVNFQPLSALETKNKLQAEMGSAYETQITGPYVIAAPKGEVSRWESRFRSLLAGYQRYFETRGWSLRSPDFPLTVIVLPNQAEFAKLAMRESAGSTIGQNLAGMYLTRTNRCLLYHLASGKSTDWESTEATIVHEAVHQLAYNTGLHERLFEHPVWMVEGLATMFEVAAVYDNSIPNAEVQMRINKEKVAHIKRFIGSDASGLGDFFDNLVSSDHLFRTHPQEAYSLAWAMTFYLAERMPKQYFEYIELQRQRGFQPYSEADRNLDFRRAFNLIPSQLAAPVLKLIN